MHKDEVLDKLAKTGNVAQFIAFRPLGREPVQTFCRIASFQPNHKFKSGMEAIDALLSKSISHSINIRSYQPSNPRSREFIYGVESRDIALQHLNRLTQEGLHTILNETVDIFDGGVSGVAHGDTLEFSPDDTPRCVERPGVASLSRAAALRILEKVYGFPPDLPDDLARIEFSLHPQAQGYRGTRTLLWEYDDEAPFPPPPSMTWPNRFSRHIGDKLFGLLIADGQGFAVPKTLALCRRIAPFSFGMSTGSLGKWVRTSPPEPVPGKFTTIKGWIDPFQLLALEDPSGSELSSVLVQDAVQSLYAGATITGAEGAITEGVSGEGDSYMVGLSGPTVLPAHVIEAVSVTYNELQRRLGDIRFEWVYDGDALWIVQLHRGFSKSSGRIIVPGEPTSWIDFPVEHGLEALRQKLRSLSEGTGICLIGEVGLTSHFADILRREKIPSKITTMPTDIAQ